MNSTENQQNSSQNRGEYPISGQDITRVVLATLLVLVAGFALVALLTMSGVLTGGAELTPQTLEEWTAEGITSLPTGLKLMAMIVQLSLIIPVLLFLRNRKLSARVYLRAQMVPFPLLGYALLVGVGVAILGDELNRLVGLLLPMPEELFEGVERALALKSPADVLTMGLTIAVIAPVVEELLFRGFFQRYFEATRGVTSGVLAASALFAAYHFNLYWLIPILVMATVMGAMAWRAESVLPSIVVHATNNIAGLYAANSWGELEPNWYSSGGHLTPIVMLVGAALLVFGLRKFFLLAIAYGRGGHRPGGDSGVHLDRTI